MIWLAGDQSDLCLKFDPKFWILRENQSIDDVEQFVDNEKRWRLTEIKFIYPLIKLSWYRNVNAASQQGIFWLIRCVRR